MRGKLCPEAGSPIIDVSPLTVGTEEFVLFPEVCQTHFPILGKTPQPIRAPHSLSLPTLLRASPFLLIKWKATLPLRLLSREIEPERSICGSGCCVREEVTLERVSGPTEVRWRVEGDVVVGSLVEVLKNTGMFYKGNLPSVKETGNGPLISSIGIVTRTPNAREATPANLTELVGIVSQRIVLV
jgi:hypothetical protein